MYNFKYNSFQNAPHLTPVDWYKEYVLMENAKSNV